MKVLITGAAGFIGSQLAYRLWKRGEELILIDNFSYGKADNLVFEDHDFTDEVIKMDIRDRAGIEEILKSGDIDYIYNYAKEKYGWVPKIEIESGLQKVIENECELLSKLNS